jgi:putative aldouronate transport system permease protein
MELLNKDNLVEAKMSQRTVPSSTLAAPEMGYFRRLGRDLIVNKELYIFFVPVFVYYVLFHYLPMYGVVIAFKDYTPSTGIRQSPWVGFEHFIYFFKSHYFWVLLRNTLWISVTQLIFGFPAPIILALLLNELRSKTYCRFVQTVTYMPHFISLIVICGMILQFTRDNGVITHFLGFFGYPRQTMLNNPGAFVPLYVISGIWQEVGWGSIIFLAALTGIDQELYEAASIDGASRFKKAIHITLPGILPTIVIMFIMRTGRIMSIGAEKIILLYNPAIYETSDVISSYVYRRGIIGADWSFSSAVGLFNSVINFILVMSVNSICRKLNETSLW